MNRKAKVKIIVDLCMTGLLLLLMGYQFWGEQAHEWIGTGMSLARRLHILGSYWGFLLMSIHLGLHWNMVIGIVKREFKIKKISKPRAVFFFLTGLVISLYGLIPVLF